MSLWRVLMYCRIRSLGTESSISAAGIDQRTRCGVVVVVSTALGGPGTGASTRSSLAGDRGSWAADESSFSAQNIDSILLDENPP